MIIERGSHWIKKPQQIKLFYYVVDSSLNNTNNAHRWIKDKRKTTMRNYISRNATQKMKNTTSLQA